MKWIKNHKLISFLLAAVLLGLPDSGGLCGKEGQEMQ